MDALKRIAWLAVVTTALTAEVYFLTLQGSSFDIAKFIPGKEARKSASETSYSGN